MTVNWQKPAAVAQAQMRASNADRERTADVLRAGFAEGRLTKDEYDERVDRALRAGTYGELDLLVGDLPQGPSPSAALMPATFAAPAPAYVLPPPPAPLPPYNGTSTAAMVCGIACVFTGGLTSVPAVVLGHKARRDLRRTGERGEGRATTGLVLGYVFITLWLIGLIGMAPFVSSSSEGGDTGPVIVEEPGPEDF